MVCFIIYNKLEFLKIHCFHILEQNQRIRLYCLNIGSRTKHAAGFNYSKKKKKTAHKPQYNELRNIILMPMTCQLPNVCTDALWVKLMIEWFDFMISWRQFLLSLFGGLIRTMVRAPIFSQYLTSFPEDVLLISSNNNKLSSITLPNMWKTSLC